MHSTSLIPFSTSVLFFTNLLTSVWILNLPLLALSWFEVCMCFSLFTTVPYFIHHFLSLSLFCLRSMSSWTYNPDDSPLSYQGHTILNHNNRTSIIFILWARKPSMTNLEAPRILRGIIFLLFTVALISYFNRILDSRLALFSGTYGSFSRCVISHPTSLITPSLPPQSTIQPQG